MVSYIVQGTFISLCITLYMYIFMLTNPSLPKEKTRKFLAACIVVDVLLLADSFDFYFSTFSHPVVYRYITSALGYSLRPVAILLVILLAIQLNRFLSWLIGGLLLCNAVLAFASIPTHCMFYFDANNQFHRGPVGLSPFLVSGIFMLILTWGSIQIYRIGNKKESAIVFLTLVMAVVGTCMETFLHFKFILDGVGCISIVFYYLFLNTQTYKRDALTHMLNRHAFYDDVETFSKAAMIIVSIDMNNLKKINDQEGHESGDQAILTVSNCLAGSLKAGCFLYRMGGDEFAMLCPKAQKKTVMAIMEKAKKDD